MRHLLFALAVLLTVFQYPVCAVARESQKTNTIIFVSFSMPTESLKGWMRDAKRSHASVVIRGLVDNSFKATVNKMSGLSQDKQGGVQVDPTLFQRFHINKVPAVVVSSSQCLAAETCNEGFDVVYGDAHLEYALKEIVRQNDDVSSIANAALVTMRESNNE